MANICVVTGGGSGMGLEAAKLVGKTQKIILVGRTVAKLEGALAELKALGIDAEAYPADTGDRASVDKLAAYAASQGTVKTVIHAAGVSPHMASADKIIRINAVGTINVDEAFAAVMDEGGAILNVSSMSGYMLKPDQEPTAVYMLALSDAAAFEENFNKVILSAPVETQVGMAYSLSKNFVAWYTVREAVKYGKKGIRVNSISPGTFATPMGNLEGEQAANFAKRGALSRVGQPEEIAKMMAFMVSDECSYLAGVDILYDGGSVAALDVMLEDMRFNS